MRLLKFAVKQHRWDLAAHTIVLAAARVINKEVRQDEGKSKFKKGRPGGKSQRA
jgi:hypothetical protein